jgi:hypothetical protein
LAALVACVGGIDEVVPAQPLEPLDGRLHNAAVAIDLHGRGPASHRILLAARPRRLVAFHNAAVPESADGAEWVAEEHEVARWCRMLSHAGIPADPHDLDLLPHVAAAAAERDPALTVIHPSAASEARRWPVERWAQVARVASTRRVTASRLPAAATISSARPRSRIGPASRARRSLPGAPICGSRLRTSVLLFGPMSPGLWGPPPQRPYHRVLWSGRRGDPHGSAVDPGLLAISVDAVLDALATLNEPARYPAALNWCNPTLLPSGSSNVAVRQFG